MKIKKILLLIIAFAMLSTNIPAVYASEADVTGLLAGLKIMQGDPDGNMRLDDYVSRAEFAKIAVAASPYKDFVAVNSRVSPFKDVSALHWAAPYVQVAIAGGLCKGYLDSTFRPDQTVLFEEAVTMMLKTLGYKDADFGASWPYGQIGTARSIGLTKKVSATEGQYMTRRDVANLVYNTLDTKMVSSTYNYSSNVSYQNSNSVSRDSSSNGNTTYNSTSANSSTQSTSSIRSESLGQSGQKLITIFDCQLIESAVLIATNNEDSSLGTDRVYTSSGILDYSEASYFDPDNIGRRGDLVVKNGEDYVSFSPDEQVVTKYNVTSVIGQDLVLDGEILNINENLTTYYKSQKSTYKNVVASAEAGDTFITFATPSGVVDYAMLVATHNQTISANTNSLEKYVIYSKLDNAIIGYKNGNFHQIDIKDDTTAYRNKTQTTYSSLKSSMSMGDLIYVKKDNAGVIEYVSYEKGNMDGPYTVSGASWINNFATDANTAVMRNGTKVTSSDIQNNDIVYFSKDLNMVLAYSNKITGIYEKASPNKDMPSTVTVSGVEYTIESVAAFNKLSSSGTAQYGDTVTLLLGKTNQIADVLTEASMHNDAYGYLFETGIKEFTSADLSQYMNHYFKIVLADGNVYEYMSDTSYEYLLNSFVRVSFSDGTAKAAKMAAQSDVSGTFNWASRKLGKYTVAENVNILDIDANSNKTLKGEYVKIYPQRIDGLNLTSSKIYYTKKDGNGVITELILNNVTGDMSDYALLTVIDTTGKSTIQGLKDSISDLDDEIGKLTEEIDKLDKDKDEDKIKELSDEKSKAEANKAKSESRLKSSTNGSYTYNLNGSNHTFGADAVYNITVGTPIKLSYNNNGTVYSMAALTKVSGAVTDVTNTTLSTSMRDYTISDKVSVYYRDGAYSYAYRIIPITDIIGNEKNYTLTAYYDKEMTSGGRVRVIIATKK